jgi:hypothetical protein
MNLQNFLTKNNILNVKEAALRMGVAERTMQGYAELNKVDAVKIGRSWLIWLPKAEFKKIVRNA